MAMKFAYHWKDYTGKTHYTLNQKEADEALHKGYMVFLVPMDKYRKNGTDRIAI